MDELVDGWLDVVVNSLINRTINNSKVTKFICKNYN